MIPYVNGANLWPGARHTKAHDALPAELLESYVAIDEDVCAYPCGVAHQAPELTDCVQGVIEANG